MKLKELLTESTSKADELESWIVDNCYIFKITGTSDNIYYHAEDKETFLSKPNHESGWLNNETGELTPTIHSLIDEHGNLKQMYVHPENVAVTFLPGKKIEFPSMFPAPQKLLGITLKTDHVLDGLETFPDANMITIQYANNLIVKSLAGIEKLKSLSGFSLGASHRVSLSCGVLRFAKCPKLDIVSIDSFDDDESVKYEKLCQVIDDSFKAGHSIVDLQSALIDAGFEEYAKL